MDAMNRIVELAGQKNLSLRRLAEVSDVPYSTLMNTKARGGQLQLDTIERLCAGLGIPLWLLFFEPDGSEKEKGITLIWVPKMRVK